MVPLGQSTNHAGSAWISSQSSISCYPLSGLALKICTIAVVTGERHPLIQPKSLEILWVLAIAMENQNSRLWDCRHRSVNHHPWRNCFLFCGGLSRRAVEFRSHWHCPRRKLFGMPGAKWSKGAGKIRDSKAARLAASCINKYKKK